MRRAFIPQLGPPHQVLTLLLSTRGVAPCALRTHRPLPGNDAALAGLGGGSADHPAGSSTGMIAPRESWHRELGPRRAGAQHRCMAVGNAPGRAARRAARRGGRRARRRSRTGRMQRDGGARERRRRADPASASRGALRDGRDVRADRRRRAHSPPPLGGHRRRRRLCRRSRVQRRSRCARRDARVGARHGGRLRPQRRVVLGSRRRTRASAAARWVDEAAVLAAHIDAELDREERLFAAAVAQGAPARTTLALATALAHNLGDLSRVVDAWPKALAGHDYRARYSRLGHADGQRSRPAFVLAGALNKEIMALENHRFSRCVGRVRCGAAASCCCRWAHGSTTGAS